MKIGYKILFTINLLQEYYTDWKSRDLVIVPSNETQRILKNYQLIYRSTSNGLIVLARITDDNGQLKIPMPNSDKVKFTFYLKSTSNLFYNLTDLPLKPKVFSAISPNRRAYYFDNLDSNSFRPPNLPIALIGNLKLLSQRNNTQVSNDDELFFIPSIFKMNFSGPTSSFTLDVKKKDGTNVIPTIDINETEAFKSYEINLSKKIAPGFYKISIDGAADQNIYLSNEIFHHSPFGLIEIFQQTETPASYKFVKTAAGLEVKDRASYFLWFKNRAAKWKYIFGGNKAVTVTKPIDGGDPAVGFAKTENVFVSASDIDLKENYKTITMVNTDGDSSSISNPNGKTLKATFKPNKEIDFVIAEVNL